LKAKEPRARSEPETCQKSDIRQVMKASAAKYKLEGKMKVAFKDDSFAFEFVRNLGFTYYGGADFGRNDGYRRKDQGR
jgi:hypothetical protein